jgi:hypothetical protein
VEPANDARRCSESRFDPAVWTQHLTHGECPPCRCADRRAAFFLAVREAHHISDHLPVIADVQASMLVGSVELAGALTAVE